MQTPPSSSARLIARRLFDSIGLGKKTLETQSILDAAMEQSGRRDFGDLAFVANIDHLLLAIGQGKSLTIDGRATLRQLLVDTLSNRAAIVAYDRQHPNVFKNTITAPIFIVGLPASGITELHQVLAQDPDNRTPITWEVDCSVPPPSAFSFAKDPRIDDTSAKLAALDRRVPALVSALPDARAAQDCAMILAANGTSELFAAALCAPHYRHWMQSCDMVASYRWHKQQLQHLQSACMGHQRWVLKSSQHLLHLQALLTVYPDACLVFVHREPGDAMADYWHRCMSARKALQSHHDIPSELHDEIIYWAYAMDNAMALQANQPDIKAVHVSHENMLRRPLKVVEEIYAARGHSLAPHARQRIEEYSNRTTEEKIKTAANPGAATHRLQNANTISAQVDRAFAGYIGSYGSYFR